MRILFPVLQILLITFFGLSWQKDFCYPFQEEEAIQEMQEYIATCELFPPPPPPEILCVKPEMPYLAKCGQFSDKAIRKACSDRGIFECIYSNFLPPVGQLDSPSVAMVTFIVDTSGHVRGPKITRSVNPEFDAEALRVVKLLPLFKPGRRFGNPVPMPFHIPIRIRNE